ncbi:response regulator [Agaribacter marinus]|uniref:DNA-binding response regulator n=1 Tax=Agaribacter marinus TaxID=1431249 RepID=A0AA37SY86_9ALTE|nr:response regulator [Agaribacter marinus]GLR71257.1 DNA-binding response regulator [Agaribacter marinus]
MIELVLVEDDPRLSELVCQYLQSNDFNVTVFADSQGLIEHVASKTPSVIVLDVMLPDIDGFQLCKILRQLYAGPLLFLTAKNESVDQVIGLELGADDYIVKPVEPRVLLARIQALLRRANKKELSQPTNLAANNILCFGNLKIDKDSRKVTLTNEDIPLTSHEFDMLCKLADNPAKVVKKTTLYTELIGREYDGIDRSADVRISRLRKKLKDNPKSPFRIKTIWGKGFFFVPDAWD